LSNNIWDVVIIGGGPAGLTAGIYTARARLHTVLIEKDIIGGNIVYAELVENYPGFPDGISGFDLTQMIHQQATKFGMETKMTETLGLKINGNQMVIQTVEGDIHTRTVIVAGGSKRQLIGAPGEKEFTGRGVSYCATCDAAFFTDQPVAIVGGGNAAIQEALHLARFASSVTLIHRRNELRATRIEQEKVFAEPKIKYAWNSVVTAIEGNDSVESLRLRDVQSGVESKLNVNGIFVAIGFTPNTTYLKDMVNTDSAGQIVVNQNMETNVPGLFAAGDIRSGSIRQVIAACADGATAAISADKYIEKNKLTANKITE
jgi:thioredoxin reductase (NADPH)